MGWSGACSGTGTCTVTMSQARSVTATFGRADLGITKTHSGNFTQGDTGDTYSLTVKNNGDGPTTATVSVVDTPPSGMTVTGMAGTGWTCDVSTRTCTRSDALTAGSSYPAITVTVDVSSTAGGSLTNSASVSGGGCSASPCGTGSDPTTVLARLSLTKAGTGTGTVSDDQSQLNCGTSCSTGSATYTAGTVVTLTASPGTGSTFVGWSGACAGTGSWTAA